MIKDFVSAVEIPLVYKLTNIRFVHEGATAVLNKLAFNDEEDFARFMHGRNDYLVSDYEPEALVIAYYRMQLFLYTDLVYDKELITDLAEINKATKLNNAIEYRQPYSYALEIGHNDPALTYDSDLMVYSVPDEMYVVIPPASNEVLSVLNRPQYDEAVHCAIYSYLMHVMFITFDFSAGSLHKEKRSLVSTTTGEIISIDQLRQEYAYAKQHHLTYAPNIGLYLINGLATDIWSTEE